MKNKGDLSPAPEGWTRPEDYLASMARRRTARLSRNPRKARTQPEAPRFSLSTLPFAALLIGLAILSVAIAIAAWPVGQTSPQARPEPPAHELGTAPKGWFDKAKKEFHPQR